LLIISTTIRNDTIFKTLADPTRRRILAELSERKGETLYELSLRLIMRHKLAMSRQAIAKHSAVLEEAGLVRSERRGSYRVLIFNKVPIKKITERWLKKS
jgi:DNA-binding transcriptional ArsR family regulator